MSCTNCYNGCAEIVSDQCVKYTGVDIPLLGIQNGDTLATVENAIISFIEPMLDGTGIKPLIDPNIICNVVRQYIPTCTECNGFNLNDILSAIIKAVCDLQIQINNVIADVETIESNYVVNCIEGVSANSGTHDILQATINKLCEVQSDLATLALDVSTNYIRIDQINDYIAAYLADLPSDLVSAKMIPYVALEFYGTLLGKFDNTGKGYGLWKDVNLCNGENGTPDKRGRVAVCAIKDMAGGTLDPEVDPAVNPLYNPNYALGDIPGDNYITLNINQVPDHTHNTTVEINDPGHFHYINAVQYAGSVPRPRGSGISAGAAPPTSANVTGLKGTGPGQNVFVTNSNIGGGQPHSNLQPVYACYYIMYIPT